MIGVTYTESSIATSPQRPSQSSVLAKKECTKILGDYSITRMYSKFVSTPSGNSNVTKQSFVCFRSIDQVFVVFQGCLWIIGGGDNKRQCREQHDSERTISSIPLLVKNRITNIFNVQRDRNHFCPIDKRLVQIFIHNGW